MNTALILKLLDLLVVGTMSFERLAALRAQVAAMVAEGRDPTEAEWDALFAESDQLDMRLEAADKRLNG